MRFIIEYISFDKKDRSTIFIYSTQDRRPRNDAHRSAGWSKYDYRVVWTNHDMENPIMPRRTRVFTGRYQYLLRGNKFTLSKHYNSFDEFQADYPEIFYL